MKNGSIIVRHRNDNGIVVPHTRSASTCFIVPRAVLWDKRLSSKAVAFYYRVMTLPETWDFSIAGIVVAFPESRATVYRCISELIEYGYVVRTTLRDKSGQFKKYKYDFFEQSVLSQKQKTDLSQNTDTVKRDTKEGISNTFGIPNHTLTRTQADLGAGYESEYTDAEIESQLNDLFGEGPENEPFTQVEMQPALIDIQKPSKNRPENGYIPKTAHSLMYSLCYFADTEQKAQTLNSTQRGRVASILGKLRDSGANLDRLPDFGKWWKTQWRSKDTLGTYQTPRPEQVLEFWWIAMKSVPEPEPEATTKQIDMDTLTRVMRERAKARQGK